MNEYKIKKTGLAQIVNNETTGTTYVKMPIEIEAIRAFIVFPNVYMEGAEKLIKQLNAEYIRENEV